MTYEIFQGFYRCLRSKIRTINVWNISAEKRDIILLNVIYIISGNKRSCKCWEQITCRPLLTINFHKSTNTRYEHGWVNLSFSELPTQFA